MSDVRVLTSTGASAKDLSARLAYYRIPDGDTTPVFTINGFKRRVRQRPPSPIRALQLLDN